MRTAEEMRICTEENWKKIRMETLSSVIEYCDNTFQPLIDEAAKEGKRSIRCKIELTTHLRERLIEEYLTSLGYGFDYIQDEYGLYIFVEW